MTHVLFLQNRPPFPLISSPLLSAPFLTVLLFYPLYFPLVSSPSSLLSVSLSNFLSLCFILQPVCPDWSTRDQGRPPLCWSRSCHLACARAPSRGWRPTCSGWTPPGTSPPGPTCWWRAATTPLSWYRRSPQVPPPGHKDKGP